MNVEAVVGSGSVTCGVIRGDSVIELVTAKYTQRRQFGLGCKRDGQLEQVGK